MEQEKARTLLGPYLGTLRSVVQGGFSDYLKAYAPTAYLHSARTRASLIHDHIVERARRAFDQSEIHYLHIHQRNLFDFRGAFLIQFKKLDERLMPSNYPTQTAWDFAAQEDLQDIPSVLPRLTVGYVPNRLWTAITGVFVSKTMGGGLEWSISVDDLLSLYDQTRIHDETNQQEKRQLRFRKRDAQEGGTAGVSAGG